MSGKRGKVLFNGLVVANVRQYRVKNRKLRTYRRHRNAALGYQGQQPNRLQGNCLASRIGTADDELPVGAVQLDCDRNYSTATRTKIAFQQRMTRSAQLQKILRQLGTDAVIVIGKTGFGKLPL